MPLSTTELDARIETLLQANDFGLSEWYGSGTVPLEMTYRFETAPAADFPWTNVGGGFLAFDADQKAAFRDALDALERIVNVSFVEDNGAGDAELSFYRANDLYTDSPAVGGGRGRWSYSGGEWDGSAVFQSGNDLADPSFRDLILHEIMHALGLKHPGDYDVGGNAPPGPFLPAAEDNDQYTLMSYNDNAVTALESRRPMLYDIAALQRWWGANLGAATGDDVYGKSADMRLQSIWDSGGTDTIRHTAGVAAIDLREGAFSSFDGTVNLSIAYGTVIENATSGDFDDVLTGNDAANAMIAGAGNDTASGLGGDDVILGQDGDDTLSGGAGNDVLNGDRHDDTIRGGDDDDVLRGGTQEDSLYGDDGNDTLHGNAGFDMLDGGIGDDKLYGGDQADNLFGGEGDDLLDGGNGFDRLFGQSGNDTLYGGGSFDSLYGQQDDDRLYGQDGNDSFWGGMGNDFLDGGAGNDRMLGGAGFDLFLGSTGNDEMWGNFNADTFVFTMFGGGFGQDTIGDFEATNDFEKIDLSRIGAIADFADLSANHMTQQGADVVIDVDGTNTITLLGVSLGDLDANDFVF